MYLREILSITVVPLLARLAIALPHDMPYDANSILESRMPPPATKEPDIPPTNTLSSTLLANQSDILPLSLSLASLTATFDAASPNDVIRVPVTRNLVVEILPTQRPADLADLNDLILTKVRLEITRHSLPDHGGYPITEPFYVKTISGLCFSAYKLPPKSVTWDELFYATTGLKIWCIDQKHTTQLVFYIEVNGVRVALGGIQSELSEEAKTQTYSYSNPYGDELYKRE